MSGTCGVSAMVKCALWLEERLGVETLSIWRAPFDRKGFLHAGSLRTAFVLCHCFGWHINCADAFCALSGSYLFLFGMICDVTKPTDPTCPNPSMPFPVLRQSPAGEITFDKRHIPSSRRYRGDFASDQHRYSEPR